MNKERRIRISVSDRQYLSIEDAAKRAGLDLSSFVRNAISMALLKGGESKFKEINLSPRNGSSVDSMMEWLCSRNPTVSDITSSNGKLEPNIKIAIYEALPETQARRFEKVLSGLKLEVIGYQEGCSRQAVHASVKRAIIRLGTNRNFAKALCDAMPDSGLTPDILLEAAKNERR